MRAHSRRDADHRAHRRGRGRGLRARASSAPRSIARPAPTCCSSRRRSRATISRASPTALGGGVPLMANMVEGGKTPILSAAELEAHRLRAGDLSRRHRARARHRPRRIITPRSPRNGTTEPFRNRMFDFDGLNALIGTPEMIALGKRYEARASEEDARDDARSRHARRAQRPPRPDRRRDGRDAVSARPSIRSSPRRTTPATASITPRPAPRWCRARPACRSSSARWRSR